MTPVSMIRDGAAYHVVIDHLGSPRLVVDASGNVVKQVDYDSFGSIISDSNPAFDLPFGFAGGMSDPDHELLRFGARDYQPSTGRWTAKDPILFAGGRNLYGYLGNDPVNFVDRDGEIVFLAVLFIFLVIVAGMFLYPDPLDIPSQGEDVKRMEFIFGTVTCGKLLKWAAGALIGAGGKIAQWGSKITNWVRKGKTAAPTTTGTSPGPYSSMTALEMEAFMDTFQSSSGLHAGQERLNVVASALKARGYSDKKILDMLGKLQGGSFRGF